MFKYHNYISISAGLIYLIMLQSFSSPQPVLRFLLLALFVYSAVFTYYNRLYLIYLQKYNFWVLLRSALLYISGFGIFVLLPTSMARLLFLVSACLLIILFEISLGNFAENLFINETLIIAFGFFIFLAALNQYFPYSQQFAWHLGKLRVLGWKFSMQPFYLLGTFLAALFLSRSFYEFIPQGEKTKWTAALAMGLFCAELFWALSLLPFHYATQALVLFSVYYFCLILNYFYLFNTLTLKKIQFHLILIILVCGITVLATPWKILS